MIVQWKRRARQLQAELVALALAYRDPRTPWRARLVVAAVVAYAFSPIDLIPDPIPVLGYLDDLVLVPLGIALALRLIPPDVMADCRIRAQDARGGETRANWIAAGMIVAIWILVAWGAARLVY
jgi:uncharacterized membrane protein YkvA (DUF1232 family)